MSDSDSTSDSADIGISDDQLPDDLVASDDTPLAQDFDDDSEGPDEDLLTDGKIADQMSGDDDGDTGDTGDSGVADAES